LGFYREGQGVDASKWPAARAYMHPRKLKTLKVS